MASPLGHGFSRTEDWDPARNTIGGGDPGELVGLERYEHWMMQVEIARELDPHHPEHPTAIARKCELQREIPESDVERVLIELLSAGSVATSRTDAISSRDLEAHDIYFDDLFESRDNSELDAAVKRRFADEKAFEEKLPEVLADLGFEADLADFLGNRVRVEIAKGAGHAMRPMLRQYDAWLRTSRLKDQLGWTASTPPCTNSSTTSSSAPATSHRGPSSRRSPSHAPRPSRSSINHSPSVSWASRTRRKPNEHSTRTP